ncbi:MAG: hypothetical protein WBD05_03115 [Phycisphaerae bacterium]
MKAYAATICIGLLCISAAPAADEELTDDPHVLKAMVRMLRRSLESRDAEIVKLKKRATEVEEAIAAPLRKRIAALEQTETKLKADLAEAWATVTKLQNLCRDNGIEYMKHMTSAEKELVKKAGDAEFARLYSKYKDSYVRIGETYCRLPVIEDTPVGADMDLEVGLRFAIISAKVNRIIGPIAMEIDHLWLQSLKWKRDYWLNDDYTRLFLYGYPTKGLADGQKLSSSGETAKRLAVAVIGTRRHGRTTLPIAVPLSYIAKGLTKEEFAMMLKQGIDPEKNQ